MRFLTVSAFTSLLVASAMAAAPTTDLTSKQHPQDDKMISTSRFETRKSHKKVIEGGKVTFYWGKQLLAPACGGQAPNDDSPKAAVSLSKGLAKCGDKIKISNGHHHFHVTVVDDCAACAANHIDVTKGVFQQFAGLEKGVLNGMTFTVFD